MKKNILILVFLFNLTLSCIANDLGINNYYESGICKYKLKDYVGAVDDFTKAIELNSTDYTSYFNRGLSRYKLGSYRCSIADVIYSGEIYNNLQKDKKDEQGKIIKEGAKPNDIDFKPYMGKLQRKIRRNWNPNEYGCSLKTEIVFRVDKSGNVKYMRLLKASGNKEFDTEAILAFIKSIPFKPLPEKFSGKSVDVKFCFDQKLNKF